ncbi:DNA-binding transcriptional activator of the SARP family [Actinokineospora terrae]|uniref:DNA-binding transcriptional activator of the SARP family n=2 Tax=Actinokineospora terrae TaxID=155974 RepID=A0A1H9MTS2_9PSEU|nr:DNA-binding transcriptional activator of the SARP family [Actinokineospora terrae]
MEIQLLGAVGIAGPTGTDTLDRSPERGLLAALAFSLGRRITRTALIDRLWSEAEQSDRTQDTLDRYARRLRAALRAAGTAGDEIHYDRFTQAYSLRCARDQVDYQRFAADMAIARRSGDTTLMRSALDLWRGPALTGVRGHWAEGRRQRLHDERRAALHDMLVIWTRDRRFDEVVAALDPVDGQIGLDDRLLLLGVEALARAGRRGDIDPWCGQVVERMREIVGTEPAPETVARVRELVAARPVPRSPDPVAAPPVVPSAMFILHRAAADFTGRHAEITKLVAAVERAGTGTTHGGWVYSIDGMPGVGKTAFALHVARRIAHRFSDGPLFLELHGHVPGQSPVRPTDALQSLLRETGIPLDDIPGHLDDRARLWRARTAGKRYLLVLDDVADHDQLRPLLPATPGSLVIITSRTRLVDLDGGVSLTIDTLPTGDAITMLVRLARRADVVDSPGVRRLVELCGRLPLAIGIVASHLHGHPRWTAEDVIAQWSEDHNQLTDLQEGDRSVRLAFDTSFRGLTLPQQDLFRLLGAHPGPDIEVHAVAEMLDLPLGDVRRELEALHQRHLVDERIGGRYRFHDLLRSYARLKADVLTAPVRAEVVTRLLRFYLHNVYVAGTHVPARRTPADPTPPVPSRHAYPVLDTAQALRWLTAELPTIAAVVDSAADHPDVVRLSTYLHPFLRSYGYWGHAQPIHQTAIRAATAAGDDLGKADALMDLAKVEGLVGDYQRSADHLAEAVQLYNACGVLQGRANALNSLGVVEYQIGDYAAAADSLFQALQLCTELGDELGRANAFKGLGIVELLRGRYAAATERFTRSQLAYAEADDQRGVATALRMLGNTTLELGRVAEAIALFERSLRIMVAHDDRPGRANVLHHLGAAQIAVGDLASAELTLAEALAVYVAHNDPVGQGDIQLQMGVLRFEQGKPDEAAPAYAEALRLFTMTNNHAGMVRTHLALGDLALARDDLVPARSELARARAHFGFVRAKSRDSGSEINLAHAALGFARAAAREADPGALAEAQWALAEYLRLGSPKASAAGALVTQLRR